MTRRRTTKTNNPFSADGQRSDPVLPPADQVRCDLTTRTYRANLSTLDEKGRSVEAVIATEDRVKVIDWERYEVIEEILRMDGLTLPAADQVPLLDTHNRFSVQSQMGSTRNFRIDGKKLIARNFYSSSQASEHAWTLCREGHLTDNSVGYRVHSAVRIEAGKTQDLNGVRYTAAPTMALRIATEWEIRENSICPIGADPAAKNRQHHNSPVTGQTFNQRKEPTMDKFKEWLQARGLEYDSLSEDARTALKKDFEAQTAPPTRTDAADATPPAAAPAEGTLTAQQARQMADEAAQRAVAAELTRQNSIRTEAAGLGISDDTVTRCLSDSAMSIEQARAAFLGEIRKRSANGASNSPAIHSVDRSMNVQRMVDVLVMRAGWDEMLVKETDGAKRAEQADKFRDMSMIDICRQAILMSGQTPPVGKEDTIRTALNTSTLPTVLGAVYNKSLLKGFSSIESTWPLWCSVGNLSDFKTHTRVRLTGEGTLEKVGDGGDLKLGSETEEKAINKLDTYGKKDRYGRQAIINDDLNVLTKVPERRGRDGSLLIDTLVYTCLLANGTLQDGAALFVAGHANLNTSKPLSLDNIQYALTQFKKQTDKAGKRIKAVPRFLLVPVELEYSARQMVESPLIVLAGTSAANTAKGNKNVLQGLLSVIAEPLLSDSTLTGYSATTWYLSGSPAEIDTLEVGFLNGRKVPTVNMMPKASDMYIEFESYIDVGVAAQEHRGLQKNTA